MRSETMGTSSAAIRGAIAPGVISDITVGAKRSRSPSARRR
jgi:hypothetical protein